MKTVRTVLLGLLCLILLSTGFGAGAAAEGEKADLQYFWFTRGGSLVPETYEAGRYGSGCLVGHNGSYTEVRYDLMEDLQDLLRSCGVYGWDGFRESNEEVLDGESFSLELQFSDGSAVTASGSNSFPPRYRETVQAVTAMLKESVEEARMEDYVPQSVDLYFPSDPETGCVWTWKCDYPVSIEVTEKRFGPGSLLSGLAEDMGVPEVHWFHFRGLEPGVGSVENLDLQIWGVEMYR